MLLTCNWPITFVANFSVIFFIKKSNVFWHVLHQYELKQSEYINGWHLHTIFNLIDHLKDMTIKNDDFIFTHKFGTTVDAEMSFKLWFCIFSRSWVHKLEVISENWVFVVVLPQTKYLRFPHLQFLREVTMLKIFLGIKWLVIIGR